MNDHLADQPVESAGSSPEAESNASASASAPARHARFCDHANDPCGMCKEMANVAVVRSDELLQGARELLIIHGTQIYRLLRTRNDKLILQK
jgi:hemin uptake protein HemP